ncbi:MAG TPA: hypothetical protein VIY51_26090 [Xanthobacteraceae bacterium]
MIEWLATSPYAEWVDESWGWPLALTIHALGMAVVVGLMAIIGLRMFGAFRTMPYTSLNKLIPLIWIAVFFQTISGFTLWMSKPGQYLGDVMFDSKFALVIIASIAMVVFHLTMKRESATWEAAGAVSSRGLRIVAVTCLLWAAVTIGGRLTAYLGSLYLR